MNEMTIGRHWLCYLPIWFLGIISVLLVVFGSGKVMWLGWFLIATDVLGYLTIKSYKWTSKEGEILIEYGVLPWQKNYIRIPASGVFGSSVKRDFLGWALDYGTITLNSLNGSSSRIKGYHMKGAVGFMEHLTGEKFPFRSSELES